MSLSITNMKITMSKRPGKLKAFVDLTIDNLLVLKGWKVIEGSRGLFLAAPSSKSGDQYYDQIQIVGSTQRGSAGDKLRQYWQTEVLQKFAEKRAETANIDQTTGNPDLEDDVPF